MTPDVRVVRGEPDDLELAALVAGLASGGMNHGAPSGAAARRREVARRRRWREGARGLSDPLAPAPEAWRWSAHLPR